MGIQTVNTDVLCNMLQGAGDAYIGALAYFLACRPELDFHEILRRSGEIATISVESAGTQTSYPLRKDLPQELFL